MARVIEEPISRETTGPGAETATTHPAFCQIGASRVSGHTHLYDSDFRHNAYMTISIRRSELRRGLYRDWHYGGAEIIEVALSEAQWATFVSAPNIGSGVPCTLQRQNGVSIPGLPAPASRTEQFGSEIRKGLDKSLAALSELDTEIEGMGLPKGKTAAIREVLRRAYSTLSSTVPFVAEQFDEHMEGTVEKAKAEVHGYMTEAIMRSGLAALTNAEPPLQIEQGAGL